MGSYGCRLRERQGSQVGRAVGVLERAISSPEFEPAAPAAAVATPVPQLTVQTPAKPPPALQLRGPADKFGDHGVELPDGLTVVCPAPVWLAKACAPGSDSAMALLGMKLLYKWPARLGGWALGEIESINEDENQTVGEDAVMCNFVASWLGCEGEDSSHLLSLKGYAKTAKSALNDQWVLLA